MTATRALERDANNRAARTFLQGLAIDITVAAAIATYTIVSDPSPIVWGVVGASLARSCVQAAAAYVMRRWVDRSRFPTPLPPDPPGEPDDDQPARRRRRRR